MEQKAGFFALSAVEQLYQMSSFPVMVCDQQLQLCWANAFALSTYPTLAMADGLETLLPANLLTALRQQAEEAPCQELQAPTMAGSTRLIFTPLEGGLYLLQFALPKRTEYAFPLEGGKKVISAFAHFFRAPLTSAFSALSVLSNNLADTEIPEENQILIQSTSQSCYKMLRASSNFTDYLRYLYGEMTPQLSRVTVCRTLENLCTALSIVGNQTGIPITYEIPNDPAIALCDADLLANALLQLVSNSLLYTREGNKIHISVRIRGDNMAITVADRGCGIPDDIQRDLFTPYFSHDPGGRPFSGLGLGLTLVKIIASIHGGTVALQSKEMEGTTVVFTIPLRDDDSYTFSDKQDAVDYLFNKFSPVYVQLSDSCRCPTP